MIVTMLYKVKLTTQYNEYSQLIRNYIQEDFMFQIDKYYGNFEVNNMDT